MLEAMGIAVRQESLQSIKGLTIMVKSVNVSRHDETPPEPGSQDRTC